jgi:hypothetical protein
MAIIRTGRRPDWYPDWRGKIVVIVASGPSAVDAPLDLAIGKARFVAINNSWRLCPWADCLVAVDYQWWEARKGCPQFKGPLKWSVDGRVKHFPDWHVKYLEADKPRDDMILDKQGIIGWGGNGGFCAINFVAQLEPMTILLVGFDMQPTVGPSGVKALHWHAPHGVGLSNPTMPNIARWRRAIDNNAEALTRAGIRVVNCSLTSALKRYQKVPFEQALKEASRVRRHQVQDRVAAEAAD